MAQATSRSRQPAFGSTASRFNMANIHPQNRTPGSYLQVAYQSSQDCGADRGPGSYNIEKGGFTPEAVLHRAEGPGWKEQVETADVVANPCLLFHRNKKKYNQALSERMGPGKYDLPDFLDEMELRPVGKRGICAKTGPRVQPPDTFNQSLGGPGSYGIPHAAMEEKAKESASTVGMLCPRSTKARGGRILGELDPILSPNKYNITRFPEEVLSKRVSERGPYDLFTAERSKPQTTGHMAETHSSYFSPGKYPHKSFLDEWGAGHKARKGRMSSAPLDSTMKTERIARSTLAQTLRPTDQPGPTTYYRRQRTKSAPVLSPTPEGSDTQRGMAQAAFGTRASRTNDFVAKRCYAVSEFNNSVARYDIQKWDVAQAERASGHESLFTSRQSRIPVTDNDQDVLKLERLRAKNLSMVKRRSLIPE